MSAETDDELHIEFIPPIVGLPADEWHSWGGIKFSLMTRAEFEEKYGKSDKDSA